MVKVSLKLLLPNANSFPFLTPGPFLIAQYGSSGELAQGFARAAAVAGGIYVLGRTVSNVEYIASTTNIEPTRGEEELKGGDAYYKLTLSGNDDKEPPLELTCKVLVAARGDLPRPLELGGRVRELTLEGEGVEYGDAYTYAAWPLARAVAIVGKRVKFGATASTRTDSTTGETGEDGAADEGPEEDGEQVGHTAAIVVFPPRCFGEHEQSEGGKESPSVQGRGETGTGTLPETSQGTSLPPLPDVAVTALITGAGTGCVPAPSRAGGKKCESLSFLYCPAVFSDEEVAQMMRDDVDIEYFSFLRESAFGHDRVRSAQFNKSVIVFLLLSRVKRQGMLIRVFRDCIPFGATFARIFSCASRGRSRRKRRHQRSQGSLTALSQGALGHSFG